MTRRYHGSLPLILRPGLSYLSLFITRLFPVITAVVGGISLQLLKVKESIVVN